jgi:hypothetical protein
MKMNILTVINDMRCILKTYNKWHTQVIHIMKLTIIIMINEIYVAVTFHRQLFAVVDQVYNWKLSAATSDARQLIWICKYFLYISFWRMFLHTDK